MIWLPVRMSVQLSTTCSPVEGLQKMREVVVGLMVVTGSPYNQNFYRTKNVLIITSANSTAIYISTGMLQENRPVQVTPP